ncbi:MAG: Protease 3 precursor [Bacteroidetes bacterium ADurb.Bin408]|nr:MAG: Protease 3 precursor [Bacteroidetes bacterium ADurb.Bin408]
MLTFERFELRNGLKVLIHNDPATAIVAVNIVYNVGARDEDENRTGFAHLFEHLMFGGSVNIPRFDEPLQRVGGENNAFTSNDITDYYETLPKDNLETALWLESDRMLQLAFSKKSLDVQRQVVCEEFRQSYLNQPYGDAWALLRALAYKKHPYKWPTIGKNVKHIETASLDEVKKFFYKFYRPCNAILCLAGNIESKEVMPLVEKWFGNIPAGEKYIRHLPAEPKQKIIRKKTVFRKVPYDKIYMAFHTCGRIDKEIYAVDLLSDLLSNGKSSRLHSELVLKKKLFSSIDAFITGSFDKDIFVITGTLSDNVSVVTAEKAIWSELNKIKSKTVPVRELQKVKNKVEMNYELGLTGVLNKAMYLAINELIDNNSNINKEVALYNAVTAADIRHQAQETFREGNCSVLYYLKKF